MKKINETTKKAIQAYNDIKNGKMKGVKIVSSKTIKVGSITMIID